MCGYFCGKCILTGFGTTCAESSVKCEHLAQLWPQIVVVENVVLTVFVTKNKPNCL